MSPLLCFTHFQSCSLLLQISFRKLEGKIDLSVFFENYSTKWYLTNHPWHEISMPWGIEHRHFLGRRGELFLGHVNRNAMGPLRSVLVHHPRQIERSFPHGGGLLLVLVQSARRHRSSSHEKLPLQQIRKEEKKREREADDERR